MVKIATWNLCLGLVNKKDYVVNTMNKEKIDICMMQETEIKKDYDVKLLTDRNYKIELEVTTNKSRCATFIKNGIDYERRGDLEGIDNHLVIIDFNVSNPYRAINIYRSFNPPNAKTQLQHFQGQLELVRNAITNLGHRKVVLGGDFNVDYNRIEDLSYRNKQLCDVLSL